MSIQARAAQYGKLFGNWKIRDFIGEGSQGKAGVFRIIKSLEGFQDENALKVVTVIREDGWPEDLTEAARREYQVNKAALCDQAVNEVRLMKCLAGNPYVVSYQNWEFCDWEESGQFGCDLLIQMPMLVTLRKLLKTEGYFDDEEIIRVGCDISKALLRCGEEGILHRDIKPANIFIKPNKKENYMLGDFGISRIVENGLDGASTTVGTLDYAAPEQFSSGYDSRVDIYSLGLTLYELANQNHLPFWKPGRSNAEAVKQRLSNSELPPPSQVDPELAEIILKACAFRPGDRYQTAEEFLTALNRLVSQPEPHRSKGPQEHFQSINLHSDDKSVSNQPHGGQGEKTLTDEENVTYHRSHDNQRKDSLADGEGGAEDESENPELPESTKPINSGSGIKRKFIISGICAVAVFVVTLRNGNGTVRGETDSANVQNVDIQSGDIQSTDMSAEPGQEPDSELDRTSMYHIILTLGDQVTVQEYNEALPILTERLELFTGGEPYEMTVEDDFIDLYLPKKAFGEVDVEAALTRYITRAADLYIFDRNFAGVYTTEVHIEQALSRDDLESVTLMEGPLDGVDATQYGIDMPTYQYIEVVLTDQCAQRYSQEIAALDKHLAFGQDLRMSSYFYSDTFPAGDGKTFYILINDQGGSFAELLVHNLTHAPLPFSFGVIIDLNSKVEWQNLEEALVAGENQCGASELSGDTITVLFEYYTKDLTAGEYLDLETEMKVRLDILEQPYAYGTVEDPEKLVLAVKTGLEHMGRPILALIGDGSPYLKTDFVSDSFTCESFSWEKDADGTYYVMLKVNSHDTDDLARMSGWMAERGGAPLSLNVGGLPLFSAEIDRQIEDGTFPPSLL